MSFPNKYLPMIGILLVGFAAVEFLKASDHFPTRDPTDGPQIALAFDDPDTEILVDVVAPPPPIEVDPLSAQRIFNGDRLGSSYRIDGIVSIFPWRSAPVWDSYYAFRFDNLGLRPSQNFNLTALRDTARSRGILIGDAPPASVTGCINPHPGGLSVSGIDLAQSVVCNIESGQAGAPNATIGVVIPENPQFVPGEGGIGCAQEVAHWQSFPEFSSNEILICMIVERTPEEHFRHASQWMDIIVFQVRGDEIVSLAREPRNVPGR